MIYVQTIVEKIPETCKDSDGNIVQTDFDLLVEEFIETIVSENKIIISLTFSVANNTLICIVTYAHKPNENIVVPKL